MMEDSFRTRLSDRVPDKSHTLHTLNEHESHLLATDTTPALITIPRDTINCNVKQTYFLSYGGLNLISAGGAERKLSVDYRIERSHISQIIT